MKQWIAFNERGARINEGHARAILTDAEILIVYGLLDDGISYLQISLRFKVSKSCIQHIASGRNRAQFIAKTRLVELRPLSQPDRHPNNLTKTILDAQ